MTEQDKPTLVPSVLNDLMDVDGTPSAGDILTYDGAAWSPNGAVPCVFYTNGPITPVARNIALGDGLSDSGMPEQGTDVVIDGDHLVVAVGGLYTLTYGLGAFYDVTGHGNQQEVDSRTVVDVLNHQDSYPPTNYWIDQDVRRLVTGDGITEVRCFHSGGFTYPMQEGTELRLHVFDTPPTNRVPSVVEASLSIVRIR